MFQRIQSIFLVLAIAATAVSFIFPVVVATIGTAKFSYNNYGLFAIAETGAVAKVAGSYLFVVAAAVLLFLLIALTQFKRRMLQVRICRLTYLLALVQFALYFFIPERSISEIKLAGEVAVKYDLSFYMPLVALVFTFLAERFILRDEKLVRSADRIR